MRDYKCLVASTTTTGTWNGLKKVVKSLLCEDLDVGQVRYDEGWPSWRLHSFSGYNSSARIFGDHLTTSVLAYHHVRHKDRVC